MSKNINVLSIFIIFVYLLSIANTKKCFYGDCAIYCKTKYDCAREPYACERKYNECYYKIRNEEEEITYEKIAPCNASYDECAAPYPGGSQALDACYDNYYDCLYDKCRSKCDLQYDCNDEHECVKTWDQCADDAGNDINKLEQCNDAYVGCLDDKYPGGYETFDACYDNYYDCIYGNQ